MRVFRELRTAAESVPDAAQSVTAAADRLRHGIDTATTVLLLAIGMAAGALVLAAYALTRDCPRVPVEVRR